MIRQHSSWTLSDRSLYTNPTPGILPHTVDGSQASYWAVDEGGDPELSCSQTHYLYLFFLLHLFSLSLSLFLSSLYLLITLESSFLLLLLRYKPVTVLTLLILLYLAINYDGSDLIITLLWITPLATEVWHCLGRINLSKFAPVLESTSRREICWKSDTGHLGKHLWGVCSGGHSHYSATQARNSSLWWGV